MEEEFVRPVDVAKRLGVSRQAVYKWINDGRLESARFGASVRIPRAALEAFIRLGRGNMVHESSAETGQAEYTAQDMRKPDLAAA